MNLSKRLKAVSDMVPAGVIPADIGCDHGYVAISLVKNGKCERVIASDINTGPLKRAEENVWEAGLTDRIDIRLSDGTKNIKKGEVDTLIISGMGGLLICDILKEAFTVLRGDIKNLILSPHRDTERVRSFLREEGFVIEDEVMVFEDGKYYTVILAVDNEKYGGLPVDVLSDLSFDQSAYDMFGPVLLMKRSDTFISYLRHEKEKTEGILKKVTDDKRTEGLKYRLKIINEALSQGDK